MDLILKQLGELVLGSVPTIILFILLIFAYNLLVRKPLEAVLAERRARTVGAVEQARGALAAAEAETSVYEDKLRAARAELFQEREQRVKQWATDRERTLAEARDAATSKVNAARREIDQSAEAARAQVESMSADLSARVLAAILPAGVGSSEVAR